MMTAQGFASLQGALEKAWRLRLSLPQAGEKTGADIQAQPYGSSFWVTLITFPKEGC